MFSQSMQPYIKFCFAADKSCWKFIASPSKRRNLNLLIWVSNEVINEAALYGYCRLARFESRHWNCRHILDQTFLWALWGLWDQEAHRRMTNVCGLFFRCVCAIHINTEVMKQEWKCHNFTSYHCCILLLSRWVTIHFHHRWFWSCWKAPCSKEDPIDAALSATIHCGAHKSNKKRRGMSSNSCNYEKNPCRQKTWINGTNGCHLLPSIVF